MTVRVIRTFTVSYPMRHVVDYLADLAHMVQWNPGTVECRRLDEGPVREGARWRSVSRFRGRRAELAYRLDRFDADRLVFIGENSTTTAIDDLVFQDHGAVTEIVYRTTVELRGPARLAAPLLRREFERLGDEVVRALPRALDAASLDG
jgi:hypothetical protein